MNITKVQLQVWGGNAGIKAVKTFAETFVAQCGLTTFNVLHAPWGTDLGVAGGAALICLLYNLESLPTFAVAADGSVEVEGTPSPTSEVVVPPLSVV